MALARGWGSGSIAKFLPRQGEVARPQGVTEGEDRVEQLYSAPYPLPPPPRWRVAVPLPLAGEDFAVRQNAAVTANTTWLAAMLLPFLVEEKFG